MNTRVSSRGQIVIPGEVRRRLGLRTGDVLEVDVLDNEVRLRPRVSRSAATVIVDPVSGLPVVTLGDRAPILTSEEVRELLAEFP